MIVSRTEKKLLSLKVALLRLFHVCLCSRTKHSPPHAWVSVVGCGEKKSPAEVKWSRSSREADMMMSPCDGRRSHAEDGTERTSCDGCRVKLLTQAACLENQALEISLESDPSPGSSGKPAASEDVWGLLCAAPGGQTTTLQPKPSISHQEATQCSSRNYGLTINKLIKLHTFGKSSVNFGVFYWSECFLLTSHSWMSSSWAAALTLPLMFDLVLGF